jgi:light-regulated signal transduction histidine kinase (bacteriophytochrome)
LYSRVGTNKEANTEVDFNRLLDEVRSRLSLSIGEAKAIVDVKPLPVTRAVRSQMLQLFQNLLANAIKYRGSADPQVEVGYTLRNRMYEFYVKDNGIGIDPKFFDKIFIIFQRLHSKTEYSGTGIGLSICKKIVERHGGAMWLESQPGKGSNFYFTIPQS